MIGNSLDMGKDEMKGQVQNEKDGKYAPDAAAYAPAVLTFFLAEVRPEEERRQKRSMLALAREHFRAPGMILLVLCCTLAGETMHCVTVFFNQKQYVRCGMSDWMIGVAFLMMTLAGDEAVDGVAGFPKDLSLQGF